MIISYIDIVVNVEYNNLQMVFLFEKQEDNMDISKIAAPGSPKSRMIYHEDPQQLHVNTLEKHCYFIPFAEGQDAFSDREQSGRFELLNAPAGAFGGISH